MTGDIESRKLIQKIREALESVLKENTDGLKLAPLCSCVRRVVEYPISKDQIERQVRLMADYQISVDRTVYLHYVYKWVGGDPRPPKIQKPKVKVGKVRDMKVKQRTLKFQQPPMADNFGPPRSPMLWMINVLGQV